MGGHSNYPDPNNDPRRAGHPFPASGGREGYLKLALVKRNRAARVFVGGVKYLARTTKWASQGYGNPARKAVYTIYRNDGGTATKQEYTDEASLLQAMADIRPLEEWKVV